MSREIEWCRVAPKGSYHDAYAECGSSVELLINAFRHHAQEAGMKTLAADDERLFNAFMTMIRTGMIIVFIGMRDGDIFTKLEFPELRGIANDIAH